jgi:hypothetical protein
VLLAALAVFVSLQGALGVVLSTAAIAWSTLSCARFFETALNMGDRKWLIAYPAGLFYAVFALMVSTGERARRSRLARAHSRAFTALSHRPSSEGAHLTRNVIMLKIIMYVYCISSSIEYTHPRNIHTGRLSVVISMAAPPLQLFLLQCP